jgi:hypothetical protein
MEGIVLVLSTILKSKNKPTREKNSRRYYLKEWILVTTQTNILLCRFHSRLLDFFSGLKFLMILM